MCKSCKYELKQTSQSKIKEKAYREQNKEKLSALNKIYRNQNKESIKIKGAEAYLRYKERIKRAVAVWRSKPENQEKIRVARNKKRRERFKTDPLFKLQYDLRTRITAIFIANRVISRPRTEVLLGCTFTNAKRHIEATFKEGMTWKNHGVGKGCWHIDHKIPLGSATNEQDLIRLFHYTNLQALWSEENIAKRDKILPEYLLTK